MARKRAAKKPPTPVSGIGNEQESHPSPVFFKERQLFTHRQKSKYRTIVLSALVAYFVGSAFRELLWPWGMPVTLPALLYASVDMSNDLLQVKHGMTQKIFERVGKGQPPLMKGPETVVFGKDGAMYLLTEDANLIKMTDFQEQEDGITVTAQATFVKDLGMGRPLGGKFTSDGKALYIADAILGLTRIRNPEDPKSKLELVASSVQVETPSDEEDGPRTKGISRILYADDVAIGPKTGKVYFTDASDIAPDRTRSEMWDTLYASIVDLLRGKATGRVLEYNPSTDETRILVDGIRFANGIAVDKDENYIVFSETFGINLLKYHLKGKSAGTIETVVESKDLTGYLDGVDCSWTNGRCFAVAPSTVVPIQKLINLLPHPFDVAVKAFLMMLPRNLSPKPERYGGLVEFDGDTGELRYIQDPTGKDISMVTGVTVHDKKLYLGSLQNDYIGVYSLE